MYVVISPAKSQDFDSPSQLKNPTEPTLKNESAQLVKTLRELSHKQISALMSISDKLADLNYQRYQDFNLTNYTEKNAKPAIEAFQGDVYRGLNAATLKANDIKFAQKHLGMISGLYGLLRPLDLMQPYRLEMKTALKNPRGKNLYEFWGDKITHEINANMKAAKASYLIDLASNEYFKAIHKKELDGQIIKVDFKENKNGEYKVIGIHAKYARGVMARYIIENRLTEVSDLQQFKQENYRYNKSLSSEQHLIFTRD